MSEPKTREGNSSCTVPLSTLGSWPPTLLMQLLDGDESLHQMRKGGGDGAPTLYGFIQLVHLEGQNRAQRERPNLQVSTHYFTRVGQG